ncbi:ATP-binding protein [Streptosporangium algeriense]|uniref:histidine kinase n=1 Tax=Streptosporangium algeriense TaxID=1682748 RepID=A0ABW3DWS3_9ACTN
MTMSALGEPCVLLKLGEVVLKGNNRELFERSLQTNIKASVKDLDFKVDLRQRHGVIALFLPEGSGVERADAVAERVGNVPARTPLETSDAEDELGDALEAAGVEDAWEIAAPLVSAGFGQESLEKVKARIGEEHLAGAVRWLAEAVEISQMLDEVTDATERISTLLASAKQYSQMDRAPYQRVDLRELLDSTLTMFRGKVPPGITVATDYDPELPPLPGYAGELNQVWTNLVHNALDAMAGEGTLTVRTRLEHGTTALVEICDTGPGVPEHLRERIFEPFFTTKAVGEGTGLGLDISYRIVAGRHGGDLRVESVPGDTRFQVRLPLTEVLPP